MFKDTPEGTTHHEHDDCNDGKGHPMPKQDMLKGSMHFGEDTTQVKMQMGWIKKPKTL